MNELSVKQLESKKNELYEMYSHYKKIRNVGFSSNVYGEPEESGIKLDDMLFSYEPVAEKAYHDLQLSFKRDPENVVDHLLGWFEIEREVIVKAIRVKSLSLMRFSEKELNASGSDVDSSGAVQPEWGTRVNEFLRVLGEARSCEHFININHDDGGDVTVPQVLRSLRKLQHGSKSKALFEFLLNIPGATTKKDLIYGPYSLTFIEQLGYLISSINDVDKKALLLIGSESGFVD